MTGVGLCHVCERPRELEDEHYQVAIRNGFYFPACWSCWFKWPDEHKLFPPVGFGHWPAGEGRARLTVRLDEVVDVLGESA